MSSKPKVLCLHGYTQNASIFHKRLGSLRQQIKEVDFVCIDAPHIVQPSTPSSSDANIDTNGNNSGNAAFDSTATSADSSNPEDIPRTWWKVQDSKESKTYHGFDVSLNLLRNTLSQDRYIGVLGFSQGAACASLLQSSLYTDPIPNVQPLDFSILVGGFKSADPSHSKYFPVNPAAKSLHVMGLRDMIVHHEARSKPLIDAYTNPRLEYHPGGHFIPSQAAWRKFFKAYIIARGDADSVASPSASATPESSTPSTPKESL